MSKQNVEAIFTYYAPTPDQIVQLQTIRETAKEFARVILDNSPQCADQQAALRKVREAVMTVNAAIVLAGEV